VKNFLQVAALFLLLGLCKAQDADQNIVLITLDGLRWEELFKGANDSLITHPDFVKDTTALLAQFHDSDPIKAREKLMPWFWSTLAEQGRIYGNRTSEIRST